MSFVPFSIDLEMIQPPDPAYRAQLSEEKIEALAHMFLELRDTIKPIIVRRISPISYQVLAGHLGYYAALRAEAIDSQFTAIQAYIAPPEFESTIIEQYNFYDSLINSELSAPDTSNRSEIRQPNITSNETYQAQFASITHAISAANTTLQQVVTRIDILESQLESRWESKLEAVIQQAIKTYRESISPPPPDPEKEKLVIEAFNNLDSLSLIEKLKQAGIISTTAKSIAKKIDESRRTKPFTSCADATSRKGSNGKRFLTETTWKKILAAW